MSSTTSSSKQHKIKLLVQRNFTRTMLRQGAAQQVTQLLDHFDRAGAVAIARPHSNRVERVEQEVRIELRL